MAHNSAVAPFAHDGGRTGVLLCHGFTGSPASMRPWGEYLARHGLTVRLPLLPGHGTTWQDMARTTWADWFGTALASFEELQQRCDRVFVFGLSMGGTLSLRLAQERGADVAGVAVVNPMVHRMPAGSQFAPLLQYVVPSLKAIGNDIKRPGMNEHCYDRLPVRGVTQMRRLSRAVTADIAKVVQPLLILTSAEDHLVHPANSAWLAAHAQSSDKSSIVLQDSYHVATLDHDDERIFDASLAFVRRLEA